jgi:hypothetical protein
MGQPRTVFKALQTNNQPERLGMLDADQPERLAMADAGHNSDDDGNVYDDRMNEVAREMDITGDSDIEEDDNFEDAEEEAEEEMTSAV